MLDKGNIECPYILYLQNVVVANLNGDHLCAKLITQKLIVYTFTIL